MSVRKRTWVTQKGEHKEAWIVDYVDRQGVRRLKTFKRKGDADNWSSDTDVAVRQGTHVADSASITVKEAGNKWIEVAEKGSDDRDPLERSTVEQYKQHLRLHIEPLIGRLKLSQLTAPMIRTFATDLRKPHGLEGRQLTCTPTMVKYVVRSLGALIAEAQEAGDAVRNPVRELRVRRRNRRTGGQSKRGRKLKLGEDIPTLEEVKSILSAAKTEKFWDESLWDQTKGEKRKKGKWVYFWKPWRPMIMTAVFTGLRSSELRGLRWDDVDFRKGEIHVRQRADRWGRIGPPKSEAGERTIPLPPELVSELRRWKLACPKDGKLGLVFPNGDGNVESYPNIRQRGLIPTVIAAGVTVPVRDKNENPKRDDEGRPIVRPKYTGLHDFRHFYASLCINSKEDGGMELPPKRVQELMGHASIVITMDRYGHLFPRKDDKGGLAAVSKALLG